MPVYLPLLIFLARICDVSIGTVRLVMVIDGRRLIAAILGFIEVVIWILAAGNAIKYLDHPTAILGYAGGFGAGVYVGMFIEDRIKLGHRVVRMINHRREINLSRELRDRGWRATTVEGAGRDGAVEIVLSTVKRRRLQALLDDVHRVAPDAMITIERVELRRGGEMAPAGPRTPFSKLGLIRK